MSVKNVLVLNASYEAVSVVTTERAITLVLLDKAEMIEGTGETFSSAHEILERPSVIRLLYMVNASRERTVPLSRRALFARDGHACGYCSARPIKLEVEHIVPRSRGGKNIWENVVTACRDCNGRKADRTPEEAGMTLLRKPYAPTHRAMIATRGDASWAKYLG